MWGLKAYIIKEQAQILRTQSELLEKLQSQLRVADQIRCNHELIIDLLKSLRAGDAIILDKLKKGKIPTFKAVRRGYTHYWCGYVPSGQELREFYEGKAPAEIGPPGTFYLSEKIISPTWDQRKTTFSVPGDQESTLESTTVTSSTSDGLVIKKVGAGDYCCLEKGKTHIWTGYVLTQKDVIDLLNGKDPEEIGPPGVHHLEGTNDSISSSENCDDGD